MIHGVSQAARESNHNPAEPPGSGERSRLTRKRKPVMSWKVTAELIFLAPFALLFVAGFAVESAQIRAAIRAERRC